MSTFLESAYSLVHQDNAADVPSANDLRNQLEKGTDESKVQTMKTILTIMLNGDPMPQLLMHIIRFVMPSKSKALKKLLYFYYEICPKLDAGGKLKQEMILVWYASTIPMPTVCCFPLCADATSPTVMELETISSTPTSTFVEIPCASSASCARLSSSNPSSHPHDHVSSIVTPTCARTPSSRLPPSTSTRRP